MAFQATIYGKYFLLDRIAVGGMAEVFKAKTFGVRGFERLLVIKRILPHLSKDEEFIEMFIDEAKISVELNHANICQVTDLGKIGDNYFIAMEFIDGKDLRATLRKCAASKISFPISHALYITMEVLGGLDYAHRKVDPIGNRPANVIHRDISPQNIMISYDADVKIVDFGIAKTEAKLNRTQAGVLKGKFGYMSPEQASGLELDARTDIFSVGILLWEMLTGRRLFLGENDFATLEKIKECQVPPPSDFNAAIPPELEILVMKALVREREDRFASAQDMQGALAKIYYTKELDTSPKELSSFLKSLFEKDIQNDQESLRRSLDSLPREVLAAAADAANSMEDRLIEPVSSRRAAPIGAMTRSPLSHWKVWLDLASSWIRPNVVRHRAKLILGGTALLTVLIGWIFWMPPAQKVPPQVATATSEISDLAPVKFLSEPAGATLFIDEEPKGVTPVSIQLETKRWYVLRLEKLGYKAHMEKVLLTDDQKTYGPFGMEKDLPESGILLIESNPPGAWISIDQNKTNFKTPATLEGLGLNVSHRVRVDLEGYEPATESITLTKAEDSMLIALKPKKVTLRIDVSPSSATVHVNGQERGHEVRDLEYGKTYEIVVSAPGHESVKRIKTFTELEERLSLVLKPKEPNFGYVNIGAQPWANVFIDGKEAGETPLIGEKVTAGEHTFSFRHPDFKPVEKKIRIVKGKNPDIHIDFRSAKSK